MKTTKLDTSYEFNFSLFGLVSNVKDFKLAWNLNQLLNLHLEKQEDLKIEFSNGAYMLISNFRFENEIFCFELLKNKLIKGINLNQQYLIPELKQFDFLIKFRDLSYEIDDNTIIQNLKDLDMIEYIMKLNFAALKSKENLLY